jgi:hypothetical protein
MGAWNGLSLAEGMIWPVLLMLLGGAIFARAFSRVGQSRIVAATVGALVVLLGGFFLVATLGFLSWADQGRLWPVYPLSLGLALLAGYVVAGQQDRGYLISGLAIGAVSLILLAIAVTQTYVYVSQIWPIALIIAGLLWIGLRPTRTLPRG